MEWEQGLIQHVACVHAAPAKWELTECFLSWPTWNGFSRCVCARLKFRGWLSGEKMLCEEVPHLANTRRFWSFFHLEMPTKKAVAMSSGMLQAVCAHGPGSYNVPEHNPCGHHCSHSQECPFRAGSKHLRRRMRAKGQQRVWWGSIWHYFWEVFKHMSSLACE